MLLSDAVMGESYIVEKIHLPFETERRLEALGMTDRTRISVLGRKGRGILIVKLRGSRFALGAAITHNIEVERAE
ncbi:MAG TPA: ferrous iron transport protein A [Candidatus Borkfalkia faecipullorum]|uniref:Ferrous iron transport protein A n=1 Tax=Candidatus Borkfalkia faecipullorum TaxID=2838510 RepID=A0A9D2AG26_9FIRM|nr:ferrous iron transport protein A [Candidatus Borkfalkia faecipullorum]